MLVKRVVMRLDPQPFGLAVGPVPGVLRGQQLREFPEPVVARDAPTPPPEFAEVDPPAASRFPPHGATPSPNAPLTVQLYTLGRLPVGQPQASRTPVGSL